jgi:hypothetical protein
MGVESELAIGRLQRLGKGAEQVSAGTMIVRRGALLNNV